MNPQLFSAAQARAEGPSESSSSSDQGFDPLAPPLGSPTFDAINFNENANLNGFFQIPPDPSGAVGTNHVVNVTNSAIEWYTKAGVRQNRQTLSSFFSTAPAPAPVTLTFDPKVIYDQYENRFVVTTMERIEASGMTPNQSRVYFAVSKTADPNGGWWFFTLTTEEVINGRETWADFPGLAVDSEAIYYTNNQFAHNNQTQAGVFQGQRLRIIAKQPFYAGGVAIFNSYDPAALAIANPASDSAAPGLVTTTMQPTQMYGDLPGGLGNFLIAYSGHNDFVSGSDANLFVQVIQVDNPLTGPTFTGYLSQWGTIQNNDNLFSGLPGAPQSGTTRRIATNDRRFSQNGVYRNGLLYCAAPILLPSSSPEAGQVAAHWFVINPTTIATNASNPPPTDQGNIGGEEIAPGTYTFFPSVAVDSLGNMAVGFAASAPSIFPGSYYTGRLAAAAPGTTQPPAGLRAGRDFYIRDFTTSMTVTSRWGDYTGIWLDPADESTFWVFNEHALRRGTILGGLPEEDGRWGNAWGKFSLTSPAAPPAAGSVIISEFRLSGPAGIHDEFIELYNNTDSIIVVGSDQWALVSSDAPAVAKAIIPTGTAIPARGHLLIANNTPTTGYSLNDYGGTGAGAPNVTYMTDIPLNTGIALFNTATPAGFVLANRLDAVGATSEANPVFKEGTGYPALNGSAVAAEHTLFRDMSGDGVPNDTNNNAADFRFADTSVCSCGMGQRLGAPGPENLDSPIHNSTGNLTSTPLDPSVGDAAAPNVVLDPTPNPGNNSTFGTLKIRRTFVNNTGQSITRLRYRIIDLTTAPAPAGAADLRAKDSSAEAGVAIGGMNPACPGQVCAVQATTLEIPPAQVLGGGFNASLSEGVITTTPLANGAGTNVNFFLGIQQRGSYLFAIIAEALPGVSTVFTVSGCAGGQAFCGGAPTISINDTSVTEGNAGTVNASFVVTLSTPNTTGTVTVEFATANGSAQSPNDYAATTGTVTFAPGETSKPVDIVVNGDTTFENNETFLVNLTNPMGATLADPQGRAFIINDDTAPSITIDDVTVTEGNSGSTTATFTVSLSAASGRTTTVDYGTANGTATTPEDYSASSGTLTFAAGVTSKTIAISVNGDTGIEPNETFFVNLMNATNATISDSQGQGTITNDDVAPTPTPTPTPTPSPTPSATPASQAINLSTRMRVGLGDNAGIGGFIITGSAPKHVIIRAIGPSLTQFGFPASDVLADPTLELHGPGSFATITNNNWRDTQEAQIQASGLAPTNDLEAAIDATLPPGEYTAIVRGNGTGVGIALVEVYDLDTAAASKLANLSTRAFVGTGGNVVIAGFVLGNNEGDDRVVVRGLGPSLSAFGISNTLQDPTLELRDQNGVLLVANDDWQDDPTQAAEITSAGLEPSDDQEAAIAATLSPGLYTAILAGANSTQGVGIVEVYDRGP